MGKKGGMKDTKPRKQRSDTKMDRDVALGMLFQGKTYREIAEAFGVRGDFAWRALNKEGMRDKFEGYLKQYLAMTLPDALAQSVALVKDENPASMEMMKLKFQEIDKVMKTAGLRPSDGTSVFIQNLTNVNSFENPLVKGMIDNHVKNLLDYVPVDAEEVT